MSRHLELFVEEASMARALEMLFSRFLPTTATYNLLELNGVENFFARLPERLSAYRAWMPDDYRIVLLCDRDHADCRERKALLEEIAREAKFDTKSSPAPDGDFRVVTRLAVEELKAWFFGDIVAIRAAYPGVSATLAEQRPYRNPDAVRGGTAEALLRVLQSAGHYKGLDRLPKLEVAQRIAEQMEPSRNRSNSFRVFWDTVIAL